MDHQIFFSVTEDLDGSTLAECCPKFASLGVVHFEDSTDSKYELPHRWLKCGWSWSGCTDSNGRTMSERLNNIFNA